MQEKILNVRFDKTTLLEATNLTLKWVHTNFQKHICTPNPEILLAAQKNREFLNILNNSDLNIADGIGILWAAKFQKLSKNNQSTTKTIWQWIYSLASVIFNPPFIRDPLPERVTGSDLMLQICKQSDHKIFLLGAAEGIADEAAQKLQKKYKNSKIVGTFSGSPQVSDDSKAVTKINDSQAEILFVAYGAPAQELWIKRNLTKMPTVKIAIGIGGAFDFITEKRKRAPKWMQKLGIEWLARLIQEPKRLNRIYKATIKFPIVVLKEKLKNQNKTKN